MVRAAALVVLLVGLGAATLQGPAWAQTVAPPAASTPRSGQIGKDDASATARVNATAIARQLNQDVGVDIAATTAKWQQQIEQLQGELRQAHLRYAQLNEFRDNLQRIRADVDALASKLQPRLAAAKAQLSSLGPAPAAGQPEESPQVALNRAELNYQIGLLNQARAAMKSAKLAIDRLLDKIQDIRRENFASILLQPIPGLYAYETWARVPDYVPAAASKFRELVDGWWDGAQDHQDIAYVGLEALLLGLLLALIGWRAARRLRRWNGDAEPPFWRRASSAAGVTVLRAMPVAIPVMYLYGRIAAVAPFPERLDWLFYLSAQSIMVVGTVAALATAAFAPRARSWRLVPASDAGAARMTALIVLLALFYSLTTLLYVITRLLQTPFALTIAVALPSSLILAGLMVALLRTPLRGQDGAGVASRLPRAIEVPVWTVVIAIVACALAGYLPLARFLAQQLIVTGSILALVYLLLLWVDGVGQSLSDDQSAIGDWLKRNTGLERKRREQLALPLGLFLKFIVLVMSVPLIMLQWAYTWPDIQEWYRQLFFGFHIGNTQVTFGALLASVIVFGLGYAAARLFQGWLDARVLQPAGISGGVRNSIRTAVGYVGITIAALAAFSYAGFNLSSLAIVAGAFSIGIGFGLQSLVNNFVSGLILLVERPIRVGDLVVVGGEEGHVRKISVRSTQVETFDRAHVLIPNSYFISEKVKNWTFRNSVRRIAIPIGIAYGASARQARASLIEVARANADVLQQPEPIVMLDELAGDRIKFTLYAFVDDIAKAGRVRTDLSIAILEKFEEHGIAMATGVTELVVRNADWRSEALSESPASPRLPRSANGGASETARARDTAGKGAALASPVPLSQT
jgi:potassium efflux system protein